MRVCDLVRHRHHVSDQEGGTANGGVVLSTPWGAGRRWLRSFSTNIRTSAEGKTSTARHVARSFEALLAVGLAEGSVVRFRASLSSFFSWCVREKLILANPVTGLARGVGPVTVQAWMGHASIATTNLYLHHLGTGADLAGLARLNAAPGGTGGASALGLNQ